MLLDGLRLAAQVVAWFLLVALLLASLPFVLVELYDGGEEKYPYSGFCPGCPWG